MWGYVVRNGDLDDIGQNIVMGFWGLSRLVALRNSNRCSASHLNGCISFHKDGATMLNALCCVASSIVDSKTNT